MHEWVGCDMSRVATAPYDPVFYLHKTFIDFLWAYWQELQRLRGKKEKWRRELKKKYWDEPLHPFDRADFNENVKTLRHNKGRDVLDYKSNLCYEYEDLVFDGKTPAQFLKDIEAASDKGYVYGKGYNKGYDNDKGYGNVNDKGYGKGRGKGKGYGYGKVNRYGHKE